MEYISVVSALNYLCRRVPSVTEKVQHFLAKEIWTPSDRQNLLNILSNDFLLNEEMSLVIAEVFSPFLLEFLSRCQLHCEEQPFSVAKHEAICVLLGKIIWSFPQTERFCIQYFEKQPSIFLRFQQQTWDEPPAKKSKKDKSSPQKLNVQQLLQAAIQLLLSNTKFFKQKWDWSPIIPLLQHEKMDIRWLASHCAALVSGMTSFQLRSFLYQHFTEDQIINFQLRYSSILSPLQALEPDYPFIICPPQEESDGLHSLGRFLDTDCCSTVVCVSGILLSKVPDSFQEKDFKNIVVVPSVQQAVQDLALAVAAGQAVLLQGPVGSGKTSLVEYLANITGRKGPPQFMKLQLGDQMDSKLLIGSHCCTDIPGEFVWKPGPLTQAMTGGHWLLLEDIDYAPMDIISLLIPVIQSKSLVLPGCAEPIKAAGGFQLFATQRLIASHEGAHTESRSHSDILNKLWRKVTIEPLSRSELDEVIVTMWPELKSVSNRFLDVYFMMSSGGHDSQDIGSMIQQIPMHGGRLISTRDLVKWCQRVGKDFSHTSETAVMTFFDSLDCFCQSIPSLDERVALAETIGVQLNIPKAKAEFYCRKHKPDINITSESVKVGRALLPRKNSEKIELKKHPHFVFAHTCQALSLLERVAVAVRNEEPVLLVGETGTGKTSAVQYLAHLTGHKLTVINMNQQSDSIDLLGGFKPVELKFIMAPLRQEFEEIFCLTFSQKKNAKFLGHIMRCFSYRKWTDLLELISHTKEMAIKRFKSNDSLSPDDAELLRRWEAVSDKVIQLKIQVKQAENSLAFSFIEGFLVKAMKHGDWILLDEINLAEAETLECLCGLLESSTGSVHLVERGDKKPVSRHQDFRLIACMNPATDVGKKELPPGIRNRFTEFFIEELEDERDLNILIHSYLQGLSLPASLVENIVDFYLHIRTEALQHLNDGTGHHPHYSLRTLCRALSYASTNPCESIPLSLYQGFCFSFLTQLDRSSHPVVEEKIAHYLLRKQSQLSVAKQSLPEPSGGNHLCFEGFWIHKGFKEPTVPENYILTPSVKQNLRDLARVISAGKYPVLIQGETSVGKTSLVHWLARASGNYCVRVNNHEHTDLQEYIGSYSADHNGKLIFQEGVLVEAMKHGHWIILDELNLAPTEVMEALNRVLDDNRELFIPETQQTVKAHPQFKLFATQNPPGLYGGRKMLSRAFRNRFIELHFDEIPPEELQTIIHERCEMPLSYCKKLVAVMQELQVRRRESGIFAGKRGYITLRDLFRWGERYRLATKQTTTFYDWDQHIADEGYLLLAGRVRRPEEALVIQEVIQKHIKRQVDPVKLFTPGEGISPATKEILQEVVLSPLPDSFQHLVWTYNMRRLAVLVGQALRFGEPVLLVGDTGCGKTTICQLLSALSKKTLYTVNCHMNSESSDFLGGLRPVRHHPDDDAKKLFEWVDGPLVLAMRAGTVFLADEISLADDSVLERLNSVLEPERTVLLAEKGGVKENEVIVTAAKKFRFLATMNPGGDFGKKELSPALRNRFTEIWCPSTALRQDLVEIVQHNIRPHLQFGKDKEAGNSFGVAMIDFLDWFTSTDIGIRCTVSVRDILSWVEFINYTSVPQKSSQSVLEVGEAYIHGACLVFLDGIGSGLTFGQSKEVQKIRDNSLDFLINQVEHFMEEGLDLGKSGLSFSSSTSRYLEVVSDNDSYGIKPFFIMCGSGNNRSLEGSYTLNASTPKLNALRLLRAMQLPKPILLEGIPGVGKTSLVTALAKASGNEVVRINLSEQTDVSDLFGADLPVEGGYGGQFAWRDGPLLQALKSGQWILLDELNLASQSVLEGLNACLDHRGEIYIPELGKTFLIEKMSSRIFGCQNPYKQGGARKGLPRSFLNRFTQVYIELLSSADLEFIARSMFPSIPGNIISKMIAFNEQLLWEIQETRSWGQKGGPWEFNLRDIYRWCEVIQTTQEEESYNPGEYVSLIYGDRMRTSSDKAKVIDAYNQVFGTSLTGNEQHLQLAVTDTFVQLGYSFLPRNGYYQTSSKILYSQHSQLTSLQSLMKCIQMNWLAILTGPTAAGKTTLVHLLAELVGHPLDVLAVNSDMDTTELLGGFEQADLSRHLDHVEKSVERLLQQNLCTLLSSSDSSNYSHIMEELLTKWANYQEQRRIRSMSILDEVEIFKKRISSLMDIVNMMKSLTISEKNMKELKTTKADLLKIMLALKSSGVVSSGGRFEWVDSILVQALRKGHWLLIDDVNLCSPSVLDRLNGLLEPNGLLTISEQGIIDGEVPTIYPHSDFRLILAMDPKNGELSHAMRNRGVEIYMLGEDDGGGPDTWDLTTLIESRGLTHPELVNTLLGVHHRLGEENIGKPSLSDMLQAASLYVQNVQRGYEQEMSIWESCQTVYVRSLLCLRDRQKAEDIVQTEISEMPHDITETSLHFSWANVVSSSLDYQLNSSLATVKQQSLLWTCLLYEFASHCKGDENSTFNELLPSPLLALPAPSNVTDWMKILTYATKLFMESSSPNDWKLREASLQHSFSKKSQYKEVGKDITPVLNSIMKVVREYFSSVFTCPLAQDLQHIIGQLISVCGEDAPFISEQLPFDLRWCMPLLRHVKTLVKKESPQVDIDTLMEVMVSLANKFQLFLCFQELRFIEKELPNTSPSKRLSMFQMSETVRMGRASVDSLPHPVIAHISPFFSTFTLELEQFLKQSNYCCNDAMYWKIKEVIQVYHHFWQVCSEPCTKKNFASHLSLFALHWTWMKKKVFTIFKNEQDGHEMSAPLVMIVSHISEELGERLSQCHKIRSKIRKVLGSPPPLQCKNAADIFLDVHRLSHVIDLQNIMSEAALREISIIEGNGKVWTVQLADILSAVLTGSLNDVARIKEGVISVEGEFRATVLHKNDDQKETEKSSSTQCSSVVPHSQLMCDLQLLPLWDYLLILAESEILILACNILQQHLMTSDGGEVHLYGVSGADQIIRKIKSIIEVGSSKLILNSVHISLLTALGSANIKNVLAPYLVAFLQHLRNGPSSKNLITLLRLKETKADQLESGEKDGKVLEDVKQNTWLCSEVWANQPPLLSLISTAALSESQPIFSSLSLVSTLSLGMFQEKSQQLQVLNNLLWKNISLFSCRAQSFRRNIATAVLASFNSLIQSLGIVADVEMDPNKTTLESLSEVASKLDLPPDLLQGLFEGANSCTDLHDLSSEDIEEEDELILHWKVGKAWAHVGLLTTLLLAPVDNIDPVQKSTVKFKYCKSERDDISMELSLYNWQCQAVTGKGLVTSKFDNFHPLIRGNVERRSVLNKKAEKHEKRIAYRPSPHEYDSLTSEIQHYLTSVGSSSHICDLISRLESHREALLMQTDAEESRIKEDLLEVNQWKESHMNFAERLKSVYPLYRDLLDPFLVGIEQMITGVQMLSHLVSSLLLKSKFSIQNPLEIENLLQHLGTFPYISNVCQNPSHLTLFLIEPKTLSLIQHLSSQKNSSSHSAESCFRIFKSALLEVINESLILPRKAIISNSMCLVDRIFNHFITWWQQEEDELRQKKEEEESLYEYRTKHHQGELPEEEENMQEISELFPSYKEEISEFLPDESQSEQKTVKPQKITSTKVFSEQEMTEIWSLHTVFFNALTSSHQPARITTFTSTSFLKPDFLEPFVLRYEVLRNVLLNFGEYLESSLDKNLIGGHLFACSSVKKMLSSDSQYPSLKEKPYDIYHDPNPAESILCRPVLENFASRATTLLQQFPDHPALKRVLKVITRIMSFPVTNPLMKFIAGLELVLTTAQEWEANAHKGVSLQNELSHLTQLIIKWRQMELRCWSQCLDTIERGQYCKSAKWWFHLYNLLISYVISHSDSTDSHKEWVTETRENVIKSLQEFMEATTLGNFQACLDLLYTFLVHIQNLPHSSVRRDMEGILFNIYNFYNLFSLSLREKISTERKPIEKEVKEFVKIVRWNDINFWAVKETVKKSHCTIHKNMKQFEKILQQPARKNFHLEPSQETGSSQSWELNINPEDFIIVSSLQDFGERNVQSEEPKLKSLPHLFHRMRQLCLKMVSHSSLPIHITALNELAGDVIEAVQELKDLDVSKGADKERRKVEARQIHQQKLKALSDLFKTLGTLGLSFQKGLMYCRNRSSVDTILVPPLDVDALLASSLSSSSADDTLKTSWKGCNSYFYKSIAQMAILSSALESPSKELNLIAIERCQGFTGNLMQITISQRHKLFHELNMLMILRKRTGILVKIFEEGEHKITSLPHQLKMQKWTTKLLNLLTQTLVGLQQYLLLLDCCPSTPEGQVFTLESIEDLPPVVAASKNSSVWIDITQRAKSCLEILRNLTKKLSLDNYSEKIFNWTDYNNLNYCFSSLKEIVQELDYLSSAAGSESMLSCLNEVLEFMSGEIRKTTLDFEKETHVLHRQSTSESKQDPSSSESSCFNKVQNLSQKLIDNVLLSVQDLYRFTIASETYNEEEEDTESKASEMYEVGDIRNNHLTGEIEMKLSNAIEKLKVSYIVKKTSKLLKIISSLWKEQDPHYEKECMRVISGVVPLLQQYTSLLQFFITVQTATHRTSCKLLFILVKTFTELAQKGFCLPAELQEEMEKDGAIEFQDIEEGGLGEGEGSKDVSDRITSEDQLEDARKEGEPKKKDSSEQHDLKEEEHGIEMSDDFEGKLHDPTGIEEEDSGDSESDEELDKKMGEIEQKDADKLDEQLWGSDSEDDVDDLKNDETGKGKDQTQSQLEAKEDIDEELEKKDSEKELKEQEVEESMEVEDKREYEGEHPDQNVNEPPPQAPEPFELPDNLKLDEEEDDNQKDEEEEGENALDVDAMKDAEGDKEEDNQKQEEKLQEDAKEDTTKEEKKEDSDTDVDDLNQSAKAKDKTDVTDSAQEEEDTEEQATSAKDRSSASEAQHAEDSTKFSSADLVQNAPEEMEWDDGSQKKSDDHHKEGQGEGQDHSEVVGHEGSKISLLPCVVEKDPEEKNQQQHQLRNSNQERTLGSLQQEHIKQPRFANVEEKEQQEMKESENKGDLYEHVESSSMDYDAEAKDIATEEQAQEQALVQSKDMEPTMDEDDDDDDDVMILEDIDMEEEIKEVEKRPASTSRKVDKIGSVDKEQYGDGQYKKQDSSDEIIQTLSVQRGPSSLIHTQHDLWSSLSVPQIEQLRAQLEDRLNLWNQNHEGNVTTEAAKYAWHQYERVVSPLVQELCEQLRLVLEPTKTSKLKGDYRTGKRLNMRKVIPYIASQFRKDKIWLRRTKPSKREYQIMLAVDDSSSMADNKSRQLAFESLALLGKSLSLLEAGEVSVVKFGEDVNLLHRFGEPFTDQAGARLLQEFSFSQKRTKIVQLLDYAVSAMVQAQTVRSRLMSKETAQLLLIISDGRGLFNEGEESVRQAVRRARNHKIFLVFLVLDNPENKDSVLDIRVPVFKGPHQHQEIEIHSYMEKFPFPFYIILRDIPSMPLVLGEALRQWFDLVTSAER